MKKEKTDVSYMDTRTYFIYGLIDPREPNKFRYVGQTVNLKLRLAGHLSTLNGDRRSRWIAGLIANGFRPEIVVIEETTSELSDERENYWILFHSSDLTNVKGLPKDRGDFPTLAYAVQKTESKLIEDVLEHTKFNLQLSASILGISRPTIYDKMRKYGIL